MNVFTKDFGVHQGRIAASAAPDGAFVYELGHALMQNVNVRAGDFHEVSQMLTVTAQAKSIRASVIVHTPAVLPLGAAWEVSAWLNGTKLVSRRLRPSKRVIELTDWRLSLLGANAAPAMNTVAFRLELV
jgi:hypothetical protein